MRQRFLMNADSSMAIIQRTRSPLTVFLVLLLVLSTLAACGGPSSDSSNATFRILSGSENKSLEPILQEFADSEDLNVEFTYKGSVDIMRELATGPATQYDAVWPANSMWIQLGDASGTVQLAASIMRSPVAFGVKKSVAQRLGWVNADVTVNDVLGAVESGDITFMMANPSQSDSGAAAYLGFLYAFAGQPDVLTPRDLQSPDVQDKIKRILGKVGRTAGDSGYLNDLFIAEYADYDAMVNYESSIIETNQALVADGLEPLYAVYLKDGTAIADSPFGYIDKGDATRREIFQKLQGHLLSDEIQRQLLQLGRRAGLGLNPDPNSIDLNVFNPEWGIDTQRILTPIRIPEADVVREALNIYQTALRKPSVTVYVLDFSGSMHGSGDLELKAAMRTLLDQQMAAKYLLQAAPDDVTIVIPFNQSVMNIWTIVGNDPAQLLELADLIDASVAYGDTDMYSPTIEGLKLLKGYPADKYFTSVVLLSDGRSNIGHTFADLKRFVTETDMGQVPIFTIVFGDASTDQLLEIVDLSNGAIFDGKQDLLEAFRIVRGYT